MPQISIEGDSGGRYVRTVPAIRSPRWSSSISYLRAALGPVNINSKAAALRVANIIGNVTVKAQRHGRRYRASVVDTTSSSIVCSLRGRGVQRDAQDLQRHRSADAARVRLRLWRTLRGDLRRRCRCGTFTGTTSTPASTPRGPRSPRRRFSAPLSPAERHRPKDASRSWRPSASAPQGPHSQAVLRIPIVTESYRTRQYRNIETVRSAAAP